MTNISVVIPVYNGALTLPELHARLLLVLSRCGDKFEIVFVDDCSKDNSWEVIQSIAAKDSRARGLRLSRNYGQHNALLCGIRAARFDVIVTLDDDLQNPPEELPKLLGKLHEGYDVVYGAPEKEQHGFLRDKASQITKMTLQNAMGAETARHVSAFRAFRMPLRAAFAEYRSPLVSIDVLLTWGTTRFKHVFVRQDPRTLGASNYTLLKLATHALNMMTGFTTLPLQFASVLGFMFALFGVAVLAYVLVTYAINGGSVPGFPFLASIIAIFAGVQLFALGIIGEYLARMHFRTMERPPYLVGARTGDEARRTSTPTALVRDGDEACAR